MKRVLLTGMSGTGKSSVVRELAARGFKAVDTDDGWSEPLPGGRQRWREDGKAPGELSRIIDDVKTVEPSPGGIPSALPQT